jgi:hypothetical protein
MAIEQAFNSDFQDAVLLIENVQPYNALTVPANPAATAISTSSIRITWADNNVFETSYVIERARKKNGAFTTIGSVLAGVTSFTDTQLSSNTVYFYRIRAVNVTGSVPSVRVAARTSI